MWPTVPRLGTSPAAAKRQTAEGARFSTGSMPTMPGTSSAIAERLSRRRRCRAPTRDTQRSSLRRIRLAGSLIGGSLPGPFSNTSGSGRHPATSRPPEPLEMEYPLKEILLAAAIQARLLRGQVVIDVGVLVLSRGGPANGPAAEAATGTVPVSKLWPRCVHFRDRSARGRGPTRPTVPHNRAMPLEIHTQPDPDHLCETCGGPSELVSQTITPWDGNETMAREVSPWTPRCADPWCQSRRPRHSKMSEARVYGH